jgi:hypothetical protein
MILPSQQKYECDIVYLTQVTTIIQSSLRHPLFNLFREIHLRTILSRLKAGNIALTASSDVLITEGVGSAVVTMLSSTQYPRTEMKVQ